MIRIGISVEGPTEREFVNALIAPYLTEHGVYASPTPICTKTVIDGPNHVGGDVSVERVVKEIRELLPKFDHVTTLYDFYGFKRRLVGESVDDLEHRIARAIDSRNFTPYVQLHEFEALLFSGVGVLTRLFASESADAELVAIASAVASPELINDGANTAPSKRLNLIFSTHLQRRYRKVVFGRMIAAEIGLEQIRMRCPRFSDWLRGLQQLGERRP